MRVSRVWGLESTSLRKSGKASWLRKNVEGCFLDGLEKGGSVGRRGAFHTYPFAVRVRHNPAAGKKETVSGFLETAPHTARSLKAGLGVGSSAC